MTIKIIHIMKDGTVRDSIEGVKVPYNEDTKVAYDILDRYSKRVVKKESTEETA